MHFVVQRQLTDVSDCTKNNLPQLLTSFHKSQLMHGTSPRDFGTLLQTCKAIYKVRRDGPIPRSGRPHDTSFHSVYLDGLPSSSIGISSVIPRSGVRKVVTGEKVSKNIDDCKPNACGDGNCVDNVNGYTCNCNAGHELMLQENDSVSMAKECGSFPLSRIVQWSPAKIGMLV